MNNWLEVLIYVNWKKMLLVKRLIGSAKEKKYICRATTVLGRPGRH